MSSCEKKSKNETSRIWTNVSSVQQICDLKGWLVRNQSWYSHKKLIAKRNWTKIWKTSHEANANLKLFNKFSSFLKIIMAIKFVVSQCLSQHEKPS